MSTEAGLAGRAVKAAAWSGVSTVVLRLGSFAVGIVLARILSPEQFGVFAIALTVQAILMAVADLGLSADIIRSEKPEVIAPTVATLGLASGTILTVLTVLSSRHLAALLGDGAAAPAISVLAFTLLFAGLTVVPYGLMLRRFQQRELFYVSATDFAVSTVVTLVLVSLGWGVLALAIGRLAAQAVSTVMQFVLARCVPRFSIDREQLRPVLAFGLPIAGANVLSWALLNADNIVLARLAGATALGFYVLAFNISNWPMNALSQIVRSISLPYFSRAENDRDGLVGIVSLAWAAALPAGAALAALSAPLIEFVYGPRWLPAAPVLAALGLYGGMRVVFDSLAGYLYAKGRSRPVLWIQVVWLVTLLVVMVPATARFGIVGAGWAHLAVAAVVVAPAYLWAIRRSGAPVRAILRACLTPTLGTIPAVAVGVAVAAWVPHALLAVVLGGLGGALAYTVVMSRWLRERVKRVRALADTTSSEVALDRDEVGGPPL